MRVAGGGLGDEIERRHAAHAEGDSRPAGLVQRAVGGDDEIGLQTLGVLLHEAGDVRAAHFLFTLQEEDDVARQRACDGKVRFDRHQLREVLSLVVADAAGVDAPVADGRLEGRAHPRLVGLGRLHVVMAVEEDGRLAGHVRSAAEHHRMAAGRNRLDLHAELAEHVDEQCRHLGDALVLGADARMADIVHQPFDEGGAVLFDMGEDALQRCVSGRHHSPPSRVRRIAPLG